MRRLVHTLEPETLTEDAPRLTAEYVAAAAAGGPLPSPWRRDDVRDGLEVETAKRCAYCDAFVSGVTYAHIEHILPKARRPDLVVSWDNLTLACPRCNVNKGDYMSVDLPLLNPYEDEPSEHIVFWGEMVFGRTESDRGEQTILRLKLYRQDLSDQRRRRIDHVAALYSRWAKATGDLKDAVAELIRDDLVEGEFYETVRAFLFHRQFPLQ